MKLMKTICLATIASATACALPDGEGDDASHEAPAVPGPDLDADLQSLVEAWEPLSGQHALVCSPAVVGELEECEQSYGEGYTPKAVCYEYVYNGDWDYHGCGTTYCPQPPNDSQWALAQQVRAQLICNGQIVADYFLRYSTILCDSCNLVPGGLWNDSCQNELSGNSDIDSAPGGGQAWEGRELDDRPPVVSSDPVPPDPGCSTSTQETVVLATPGCGHCVFWNGSHWESGTIWQRVRRECTHCLSGTTCTGWTVVYSFCESCNG